MNMLTSTRWYLKKEYFNINKRTTEPFFIPPIYSIIFLFCFSIYLLFYSWNLANYILPQLFIVGLIFSLFGFFFLPTISIIIIRKINMNLLKSVYFLSIGFFIAIMLLPIAIVYTSPPSGVAFYSLFLYFLYSPFLILLFFFRLSIFFAQILQIKYILIIIGIILLFNPLLILFFIPSYQESIWGIIDSNKLPFSFAYGYGFIQYDFGLLFIVVIFGLLLYITYNTTNQEYYRLIGEFQMKYKHIKRRIKD